MLILSRKAKEVLHIGEDIRIVVTQIRGDKVSIGVDAPRWVRVMRAELLEERDGDSNRTTL